MDTDLESIEHKNSLLRPSIFKLIFLESGTTTGRTFKLCGAIGVMIKSLAPGTKIGPPQLKE